MLRALLVAALFLCSRALVPAASECGDATVTLTSSRAATRGVCKVKVRYTVRVSSFFTDALNATYAGGIFVMDKNYSNRVSFITPGLKPTVEHAKATASDKWTIFLQTGTRYRFRVPYIRVAGASPHSPFCVGVVDPTYVTTAGDCSVDGAAFSGKLYGNVGHDLFFAIDTTGSMAASIANVKRDWHVVTDALSRASGVKIGIVEYNDPRARVALKLSANPSTVNATVRALYPSLGLDPEECVFRGVDAALSSQWSMLSRRTIFVMGDAPGKDPEPRTNLTLSAVANRAGYISIMAYYGVYVDIPVPRLHRVFTIPIGRNYTMRKQFRKLAVATGGKFFPARTPDDVPAALADAIAAAVPDSRDLTRSLLF